MVDHTKVRNVPQLHSLSHWENAGERSMDHQRSLKTCHFYGPTCKCTTMTTIIILEIEPSERLLIASHWGVKLCAVVALYLVSELSGFRDSQLLKQTSYSYIAVHALLLEPFWFYSGFRNILHHYNMIKKCSAHLLIGWFWLGSHCKGQKHCDFCLWV